MSNILVLDDDNALRAVIAEYLESRGHTVQLAGSADDAVRIAASGEVVIALIDLFLPESDGLSVIERAKSANSNLKIIAVSGGSKMDIDTCLNCAMQIGADASLAKPFTLRELERLIVALNSPLGSA